MPTVRDRAVKRLTSTRGSCGVAGARRRHQGFDSRTSRRRGDDLDAGGQAPKPEGLARRTSRDQ
jgi:hypothetical protein